MRLCHHWRTQPIKAYKRCASFSSLLVWMFFYEQVQFVSDVRTLCFPSVHFPLLRSRHSQLPTERPCFNCVDYLRCLSLASFVTIVLASRSLRRMIHGTFEESEHVYVSNVDSPIHIARRVSRSGHRESNFPTSRVHASTFLCRRFFCFIGGSKDCADESLSASLRSITYERVLFCFAANIRWAHTSALVSSSAFVRLREIRSFSLFYFASASDELQTTISRSVRYVFVRTVCLFFVHLGRGACMKSNQSFLRI